MKKEKNKTNKILIFLGILIGILSLLGISYAIWVLKLNQTNFNIVNSSCLKLNLINEKNDINIENAYPLLNEEGKSGRKRIFLKYFRPPLYPESHNIAKKLYFYRYKR